MAESSTHKKKVLFTTNIPVPYRVCFFNELGKYVDLTVTFERSNAKTRKQEWLDNSFLNFKGIFLKGIQIGDDLSIATEIIRIIKRGNFDDIIIGAYYSPTGILATEYMKLKRIPFMFSEDGGLLKEECKFKYLIKKHLKSGGKTYFSPSAHSDDILKHYGVNENKLYRYPFTSLNDDDILRNIPSSVEKNRLKNELGITYDKVVLGVGRLVGLKKWGLLIEVSRRMPGVGFFLVGGNPYGSCYEKYLPNLPNNFHFIDFKTKEILFKYYQAADVLAMPTSGDVWGLVINEAMANGLPIVSTDKCTASLELLKQKECGILFKVGDGEGLRCSLEKVLYNEELRYRMANNCLSVIQQYSIKGMAKAYFEGLSRRG